jgi:hypothetical protein
MNSIRYDPAHGTYRMEFYREVFDIVAQSFTQLRTLIMPHQYAQQQIEGLLERMPPHLTELGCTVLVWPLFAPLPSIQHLRSLHLFHGQFHKGGIGLDPARLSHLSSLQLSNLDCNSDDPDKFNIKVEDADYLREAALAPLKLFPLAAVFAGLSSLRTLTLPCIPQIELLLAHVHLCPSLGLLQLQWVGLAKKCGVIPASLSHPTPASVLQLLQQSPSLRVHFVRAREELSGDRFERSSFAPSVIPLRLKRLWCAPTNAYTDSAVRQLLATGRVEFLWADPLHCLPPAGHSGSWRALG